MRNSGKFTNRDIGDAIASFNHYAGQNGIEDRDRIVTGVYLEEILFLYMEKLGADKSFTIKTSKSTENIFLKLEIPGENLNPSDFQSEILQGLEKKHTMKPEWTYNSGRNQIVFTVPMYHSTGKNLKFAWTYVSRYKAMFFFAVICQWLSIAMSIIAPILSAKVIVAYTESNLKQVVLAAAAILAVDIVTDATLYLCNTRYNIIYARLLSDIENDLTKASLKIKNACIEAKGGGLFIQRLTGDTDTLATGFNTIVDQLSQIFNYLGILIAMFVISPLVFAIVVAILACQIATEFIRTRRMFEDDRIYRNARERLSGFISEMVHGVTDIKSLNSEDAFCTELQRRVEDTNSSHMHLMLRNWRFKLIRWGFGDTGKMIFTCMLAAFIATGYFAPAIALVLFNYYQQLGASAVLILGQFLEFLKSFDLSAERINAIISSPEFPKDEFGNTHLDLVRGNIRFDNVSFAYESSDPTIKSKKIVRNMNFEVSAGSMVALVGKSGCGKTTVFKLVCKLVEAGSGAIFLDDNDMSTLDKDSIRGSIAVVNQSPYFFHMTIRENLSIAKPDLTEDEMKEVCKKVCMFDDIEAMPLKYDSLIGEGGVNLSGGQRQRLAIARCLLKDSPIILLDEATSALDNMTQMRIQETLDNIRKERTIFVIAHRLSTVIGADKIMFMEDGRILDEGTHATLMERCESYRELYEAEE
ncbi:ABC transporter ATP-binding protein [Butyrivibrio sp. JL13D10]|uniref:ABC transporter ATP-binding protein n=1 Tax=Butyrivibrio sp. JL13D10 TaxID=3236815 RepID=UPI0038B5F1F4